MSLSKGALRLLLCSLLFHFDIVLSLQHINTIGFSTQIVVIGTVAVGVTFLLYPLIGWLAEVYFTRYRVMVCGVGLLLLAATPGLLLSIAVIFLFNGVEGSVEKVFWAGLYLLVFIGVVAFGMFESSALQFGMDQLLDASTEQLKGFVRWYYWTLFAGPIPTYYLAIMVLYVSPRKQFNEGTWLSGMYVVILNLTVFFPLCIVQLCLLLCHQKDFHIFRTGINPFSTIAAVICYCRKHAYPEKRSAFTYWEQEIPSRIDLAKKKYGGPFTTEEVEDVKTFFRILLLLISLTGLQLSGDTYSLGEQLQLKTKTCPSLPALLLVGINPNHFTFLLVALSIPLYELCIRRCFTGQEPLMLSRMFVGLLFVLLSLSSSFIIRGMAESSEERREEGFPSWQVTQACLEFRLNGSVGNISPTADHGNDLIWWLALPQLLNGVAHLLVFMTALEFICAQAPRSSQGLLIGLWHTGYSVRLLVVGILDNFLTSEFQWYVYQGVKTGLVFLFTAMFWWISTRYRYRQRDDVVNEQFLVEDTYSRYFDQRDRFQLSINEDAYSTSYGSITEDFKCAPVHSHS